MADDKDQNQQKSKEERSEKADSPKPPRKSERKHQASSDKPQPSQIKKKGWYQIIAPKAFNNALLGETFVYDPNRMIGKTAILNLMGLTNDVKKQSINIKFAVNKVEDNKARTETIAYAMVSATVKRLVRRSCEKIELSFLCRTKDAVPLRVKPFLVTKTKTNNSTLKKLRRITVEFLTKKIELETYDDTLNSLVSHKLQNSLRDDLKKIYPLKTCEIRYAGIEMYKKAEVK